MLNSKTLNPGSLAWDKMDGLLPAIVQHAQDRRVLMLAYMNRAALEQTQATGLATFWSRSRSALWTKGETSGNHLHVQGIHTDCDGDCLLVQATPEGPTCHLGPESCFAGCPLPAETGTPFLAKLEAVIAQRDQERPAGSYTTSLFESGLQRMAQKVGEEGVETALAAVSGEPSELVEESADLLFHLLVLLRARGVRFAQVLAILEARHGS